MRSSPACPRPSCTSTTSAPPRRASSPQLAARHAGATPVPADPERARRVLHLHRLRALHRRLPVGRRPHPRRRGRLDAHLRGRPRPRRAERALRRADPTPYSSIVRGIPAEAFCEAVEDARRRAARRLRHRSCAGASTSPARPASRPADVTLDIAAAAAPGRAGQLRPRRPRARRAARRSSPPHFAAARAAGLHSVPHAGESTGPETIWDALRRTSAPSGSATASPPSSDPRLLAHLRDAGHPARGLPDLQRLHPRRCRRWPSTRCRPSSPPASPVTINSDDPPMFSTTLNHEYAVAAELLDLDEAGVAELAEPPCARRSWTTPARPRCWPRSTTTPPGCGSLTAGLSTE